MRDPINWALLILRVSGSLLLLHIHGMPKLLNYQQELLLIEDPLGLGAGVTLSLAIFAEVLCPLLIVLGLFTRLACLPILVVLLVSLGLVHPQWTLAEGQFAWLLLSIFTSVFVAGAGRFALGRWGRFSGKWQWAS